MGESRVTGQQVLELRTPGIARALRALARARRRNKRKARQGRSVTINGKRMSAEQYRRWAREKNSRKHKKRGRGVAASVVDRVAIEMAQQDGLALELRWNPSRHPRHPKGSSRGGQFREVVRGLIKALRGEPESPPKTAPKRSTRKPPVKKVATKASPTTIAERDKNSARLQRDAKKIVKTHREQQARGTPSPAEQRREVEAMRETLRNISGQQAQRKQTEDDRLQAAIRNIEAVQEWKNEQRKEENAVGQATEALRAAKEALRRAEQRGADPSVIRRRATAVANANRTLRHMRTRYQQRGQT